MYSRKAADFIFNIIDTSSLMAQGGPDEAALSLLSEFLSDGKEVDVVLYLDRISNLWTHLHVSWGLRFGRKYVLL